MVGKTFDEVVALEGASFSIPEGGFASVLGQRLWKINPSPPGGRPDSHSGFRHRGHEVSGPSEEVGMMFPATHAPPMENSHRERIASLTTSGRVSKSDRKRCGFAPAGRS